MNGAYGVVAALHERERTGRGRVVRTSLLAGMVGVHAFQGTRWTVGRRGAGAGRRPPPGDRAVRHVRDRRPPRCRSPAGPRGCGGRCAAALGLDADDAALRHQPDRVAHRDELVARDRGALRRPTPAEHWLRAARRRRRAVGQGAHARRRLRVGADPVAGAAAGRSSTPTSGSLTLPGSPLRFDDNAFSGGRADAPAAPDARPARRGDPGVAGLLTGRPRRVP